jgi:hypothetical protein
MVAVGDVYELVIQCTEPTGTVQSINALHFRQKAGFLSAINLIGEWRAACETQYRNLMSSGYAIRRYAARSLIPYNTDFYETFLEPTLPGTRGVRLCPLTVAQIITWRTGLPGRRKRGRTYIPGVNNDDQTAGLLTALYVTNTGNAFGNAVMSRFGPGGLSPQTEIGVWSRVNGNQDPPHDPAGFTPITAFTFQQRLGSMGTRRYGRGM